MHDDVEVEYTPVEKPKVISHYHGDTVRALFIASAVLIFLTQFIGAKLPYSIAAIMTMIVVLVVAAGITNPVQRYIHTLNLIISLIGLVIFGGLALTRVSSFTELLSQHALVTLIAILFIGALYFATSTLRGFSIPHIPQDPQE